MKNKRRLYSFGLFLAMTAPMSASPAQSIKPEEVYAGLVSATRSASPLSLDALGDLTHPLDGTTRFQVTDIEVQINSDLPFTFGRKLDVTPSRLSGYERVPYSMFGIGWMPAVPYMRGTFAATMGWVGAGHGNPDMLRDRCSRGLRPSDVPGVGQYYWASFPAETYWTGVKISIPGEGEEPMLGSTPFQGRAGTLLPFVRQTKSGWQVACLDQIRNQHPGGEGFIVVTAKGHKYYFDWMVVRSTAPVMSTHINQEGGDIHHQDLILPRDEVTIYATRVEDRFGNSIDYTYSSASGNEHQLTRMRSSDGAQMDFSYDGKYLASVSVSGKIWRYEYSNNYLLSKVLLPDQTFWSYAYQTLSSPAGLAPNTLWRNCDVQVGTMRSDASPSAGETGSLTVTHPSGMKGVFNFRRLIHGTSRTPGSCTWTFNRTGSSAFNNMSGTPKAYHAASLYSKTISGPGISPVTTTYHYSPSWSYKHPYRKSSLSSDLTNDCPTAQSCPSTATSTVTRSTGEIEKFVYGIEYEKNAGQLLEHSVSKGGTVSRRIINSYVTDPAGQFPDSAGSTGLWTINPFSSKNRPLKRRVIHQDASEFTYAVSTFDSLVRPLSETKSSTVTGNPSRTEVTTYHDNLSKWVLGQPSKLTINGIVVSEIEYTPKYALPLSHKAFGKLQQTLGYTTSAGTQMGTLKTVTDGNGNTTTLTGWKRGVPQSVAHADGTTQSAVINDAGWITRVTDENGYATNYEHDPMGRTTKTIFPTADGEYWRPITQSFTQVSAAEYGIPAGHWRQSVYHGGRRQHTYYDALWRPILAQEYDNDDPANTRSVTAWAYDHEGRQTFASYPQRDLTTLGDIQAGVRTSYDPLGRIKETQQNSELGDLVATYAYLNNDAGPYTRITDPKGNQTRIWYQQFDAPSTEFPTTITNPGGQTDIVRDIFGKPKSITRSGGGSTATRNYVYNAQQELCKAVNPENRATIMAYDAAGNLAWSHIGSSATSVSSCSLDAVPVTDRTVRTYDARNRIKTLLFPDGVGSTTYAYTPDGLPKGLVTENGNGVRVTNAYTYNLRRLLAGEGMDWGSGSYAIGYGYDANGHLTNHVLPRSQTISYAPNALGQPTKAGTYATDAQYHPNGAIKQFTYGNDVVHTQSLNTRRLPLRIRDTYSGATNPLTPINERYSYDKNGNVESIADERSGNRGDRVMTYDELDRLTKVESNIFGTATYTYDALDNLRRVKVGGTAMRPARDHTYTYDTLNRLDRVTHTAGGAEVYKYYYDPQGNVRRKGSAAYTFDAGNRLREATEGGVASQYWYDGHGRRVRDFSGGSKYSLYGGDGKLRFAGNIRADTEEWYIYLGDKLVALRTRNRSTDAVAVQYQHTDMLGSVAARSSAGRGSALYSEYEPFGALSNRANHDRPAYTGHVQDAATGLTYMQQRYYDPQIGRFLSVDPVSADGNTGGNFNRYKYAANNPYKFTDPDGQFEFRKVKEFITGVMKGVADGALADAHYSSMNPTVASYPGEFSLAEACDCDYQSPFSAPTSNEEQFGWDMALPASIAIGLVTRRPFSTRNTMQANKLRGDAFRDEIADLMRREGRDVQTEVVKRTPFGRRVIDIEVSKDGRVLGGIETKAGNSRYHPSQRAKDEWLRQNGYPVDLVRDR